MSDFCLLERIVTEKSKTFSFETLNLYINLIRSEENDNICTVTLKEKPFINFCTTAL